MNLFKLLIMLLCFRCESSFLNSVQFKYYKTPRLIGKNHSTYVNTPHYLRNKKNKIDKITIYSHPIDHSKNRRPNMFIGDTIGNRRIPLGTIYVLMVMYVSLLC